MTSLVTVAFVAHPVGPDGPPRVANLARAERWLRWLILQHEAVAFVVPWLPYCHVLDESHRDRGFRDNMATLAMCGSIVLVGGELSPGMRVELDFAKSRGLPVVDYLHLGPEPPRIA